MGDAGTAVGEAGGIFAGVVALAITIGKGLAWAVNWRDARAQTRSAKLQVWHEELTKRDKEQDERDRKYHDHIEGELGRQAAQLRRASVEIRVLRTAFELVAEPLRRIEPQNPNLTRANQLLAKAFPLDPALPADIATLITMIDQTAEPLHRI